MGAFKLTETDTDKKGLYRIMWTCSYTETLVLLGTVAIVSVPVLVSVSVNEPLIVHVVSLNVMFSKTR